MRGVADQQEELCARAFAAEAAGRYALAREVYLQALRLDPANPTPFLFLGFALERLGEKEAAAQVYSLAADRDPRVVNAWRNEGLAPAIRERSRNADLAIRAHFTRLHETSVNAYREKHPGAQLHRIYAAIWCQTHDGKFEYRQAYQQPHLFYVPDLAPIAVFPSEQNAWMSSLEEGFETIRAEYLAMSERASGQQRPYLAGEQALLGEEWNPLKDTLNWGSFHLYKDAKPNDSLLSYFPRTLELLEKLPTLDTAGFPREVLFSVLRGGQSIPPHYGLANTDATVHLPIVVTSDSGIRVVDERHAWRAGEVFAFDDSFEHESWNRSPEARVNLLLAAWHPDLSIDERGAVAASFEARDAWRRARRLPAPAGRD